MFDLSDALVVRGDQVVNGQDGRSQCGGFVLQHPLQDTGMLLASAVLSPDFGGALY
jgi:hypothetical protein